MSPGAIDESHQPVIMPTKTLSKSVPMKKVATKPTNWR